MNDGDWICVDPNCGNINFARRSACYRCNKERPETKLTKKKLGTEIGKSAAEKSRGLFNADDWQCNKCANVNWARRQTCNVCNAPKFGEVEARTGYGGGYNERGVVEYRRREPSSDDEYDEFGRKKRKRRPDDPRDSPEKVGITEGAVFKNMPPAKPQMEMNMEMAMPAPACNVKKENKEQYKISGNLSDGSVCDVPPVSLPPYSLVKNQLSQDKNHGQNLATLKYRGNVNPQRKRYFSTGEREQTASSGYETGPKRGKHESSESPVFMTYNNPVMENMVTSTNDVVYKFNGLTPAESFEVTYTIEERVKAAAFAITYNNCKISTERFESIFDKPAPDFKTIFSWRQRLLSTGCLIDNHSNVSTSEKGLQANVTELFTQQNNSDSITSKPVKKSSNPEEIPIISDSEDDLISGKQKSFSSPGHRSVSAETLLLSGIEGENKSAGNSGTQASLEGCGSHTRSRSSSSRRSRSSSSSSSTSSQRSKSADSDLETNNSQAASSKTTLVSARRTTPDTNSDSVSYNSDDENFLSRKFPEGRKMRRKVKKRAVVTVPEKPANYVSNDVPTLKGYSTATPLEKPPLATGNIYTPNLRNMNVKRPNMVGDVDGCSNEYVPTRFGATAKKNYQQFRDNVRKKGFWAKGNGTALGPKRNSISSDTSPGHNEQKRPIESRGLFSNTYNYPIQNTVQNKATDFKTNAKANYSSFDKPAAIPHGCQPPSPNNAFMPVKQLPLPKENIYIPQPPLPKDHIFVSKPPLPKDTVFLSKPPLPKDSVFICQPPLPKDPIFMTHPPLPKDPPPLPHSYQAEPQTPKEPVYQSHGHQKESKLPNTNPVTPTEQPPLPRDPNYLPHSNPLKPSLVTHLPLNNEISLPHPKVPVPHQLKLPAPKNDNFIQPRKKEKSPENTASIFEAVQTKSSNNNRSIMDIFDGGDKKQNSPERNYDLEKYDNLRKKYESEWDEDDDALYGSSDVPECPSSPTSIEQSQPSQSPTTSMLYAKDNRPSENKSIMDIFNEKNNVLMGLMEDFQIKPSGETETKFDSEPLTNSLDTDKHLYSSDSHFANIDISMIPEPEPIPKDVSEELIRMSEEPSDLIKNASTPNSTPHKQISPSKRVQVLESVTIHPNDKPNIFSKKGKSKISPVALMPVSTIGKSTVIPKENVKVDKQAETPIESVEQAQPQSSESAQQPDFSQLSNLLSGINTNTLLLALQNLQQLSQGSLNSSLSSNQNDQDPKQQTINGEVENKPVETINLTNDEEWEKESNRDGSIERQLEQMDGDPSATPFLSDIFDPSPVKMPSTVAKKLNLNLKTSEEKEQQIPHVNENAPVIGNFKSFALPKPLILNRLKLTVKTSEKPKKPADGKRRRKKKSKPSGSQEGGGEGGEDDEEESGDEADLSKYDLWGSEDERDKQKDAADKSKEGESSKDDDGDKNGKSTPDSKHSKRSRRSSSSSSSSSTSSSSSQSSQDDSSAKNKFDDFNLNSERESSPKGRSRSPRPRPAAAAPPPRRKSRDTRSAGETRSQDKEWSRDRERRDRSRGDRKERRYSRDGNHYGGRHR